MPYKVPLWLELKMPFSLIADARRSQHETSWTLSYTLLNSTTTHLQCTVEQLQKNNEKWDKFLDEKFLFSLKILARTVYSLFKLTS